MLARNSRLNECVTQPFAKFPVLLLTVFVIASAGLIVAAQPPDTQEKPNGAVHAGDPAETSNPFQPMIDEQWTEKWKWFSSDPDIALSKVWQVVRTKEGDEPTLICTGQPKGFLHTAAVWTDFEMTLEWKYTSDPDGNSGVLIFVQEESRVWPTSIQVQLHQPKAGSVFPSGDAKSDNTTEADLAKPVGEWNTCRIVSLNGTITVEINGTRAGEITGAIPATGKIALQSEGSEVHFRRLKIRPVASSKNDPPPAADDSTS